MGQYVKRTWKEDNTTPLTAAALNNMENGIGNAITGDGANLVYGSSGTIQLGAGSTYDLNITYPVGLFAQAPKLVYSLFDTDVDGAYLTAHSKIANTKDGATIRIRNKGTALQYYSIDWQAVGK